MDKTYRSKHEKHVTSLLETVESYINPFEYSLDTKHVVNIYNGRLASDELTSELKNAHVFGEESYLEFLQNLMSDEPNLFKPIEKLSLKTFAEKVKKTSASASSLKTSNLTRDLFGRLLLLSSTRELDLTGLLGKSLTTLPLSLGIIKFLYIDFKKV